MITSNVIEALITIPFAIALYYLFWRRMEKKEHAELEKTYIQEVNVIVNHGYFPDVITAKAGRLLQVNFLRKGLFYCSEEVVFPDFNRKLKLPPYIVVSTQFTPEKPGEYVFQCGRGKLKGKLVVS